MIPKPGMQHEGLKLFKVGINDDRGLTLTYFTARSKLEARWPSGKGVGFWSEKGV